VLGGSDEKGLDLYAVVTHVPGVNGDIELRHNPRRAAAMRGWDELSLAVKDNNSLREWIKFLDENKVKHSDILPSLGGYLVVFEDPDGRRIRLNSTNDRHGPEVKATDQNNFWVSDD
jgi:hypothetical protein